MKEGAQVKIVTILWSLYAALAIMLAVAFGLLWLIERRNLACLMLCILGIAAAASAFAELGLMHSITAAEYGEWLRWYHLPVFFTLIGQLLFVHYYLGTGRLWLLWAVIFARSVVLAVNFSVHPNFNFSHIVSLSHVSLLGEQVSVIGVGELRTQWQWFALASLVVWIAYLIDAGAQRWLEGGSISRHKALTVSLGMVVPLLCTVVYTQLLAFRGLHLPISNLLWFLGALMTMAYELGRDFILGKRAGLELAELRSHLAQTERVSVLGELASTLAHELTQPLAATSANVESVRILLQSERPDLEELRAVVGDIGRDNHRAAEMIARMRQFLKRRTIDMQPLNIEDVVHDVVSLVHSEATSKHIALNLLMQPRLPRVLGDRVLLAQVLLNLLMNSIHAVQSCPFDARRIVVESRAQDAKGEVEVAVRDSGPGIPESIVDNVFKPFFTTTPEGMGMGLALSRTIVEAHGGRLWIDITEKDGAIVRFSLRRA